MVCGSCISFGGLLHESRETLHYTFSEDPGPDPAASWVSRPLPPSKGPSLGALSSTSFCYMTATVTLSSHGHDYSPCGPGLGLGSRRNLEDFGQLLQRKRCWLSQLRLGSLTRNRPLLPPTGRAEEVSLFARLCPLNFGWPAEVGSR